MLHGLFETLQTQKESDFQRDPVPGVPPKSIGDDCAQLGVKKKITQTQPVNSYWIGGNRCLLE